MKTEIICLGGVLISVDLQTKQSVVTKTNQTKHLVDDRDQGEITRSEWSELTGRLLQLNQSVLYNEGTNSKTSVSDSQEPQIVKFRCSPKLDR